MAGTSTLRIAAVVLLLCALAAGCGSARDGGTASGDATGSTGSTGSTELSVRVVLGPDGGKRRFSLSCDPPGGDHPAPGAACRSLQRMTDPFAPVPRDAVCTEIYGGPQTAVVTGTFEGEPVRARFSRTDGCEISRWEKHQTLLVVPGGVDP